MQDAKKVVVGLGLSVAAFLGEMQLHTNLMLVQHIYQQMEKHT